MFLELLLIILIAALVLKPEQWPVVAKKLGLLVRYFRHLYYASRNDWQQWEKRSLDTSSTPPAGHSDGTKT